MFLNWIIIILIVIIFTFNFWWAWIFLILIFCLIIYFKFSVKIWGVLLLFPCLGIRYWYINDNYNHHLYHQAQIVSVKSKYVIVKEEHHKYKINYFNQHHYHLNETIRYAGNYVKISNHHKRKSTSTFNAELYFLSIGVRYEVTPEKIYHYQYHNNIVQKRVNYLTKKPHNKPLLKWFSNLFVLLIHDKNQIYQVSSTDGYVNLLTVSGFHIVFIYIIITTILKYLTFCKIKRKYLTFFAIALIWYYLFLLHFPLSSTRAITFLTLNFLNTYYWKKHFNNIDILSITGIGFIYENFYNVFSLSYLLSFYCTFIVILIINMCNLYFVKISNFHKTILISVFVNLLIIPINIYIDQTINFTAAINNVLMEPFILISYILIWLYFVFPIIEYIVNWYLNILVKIMIFLNRINFMYTFHNQTFSIIMIVLWSLLLLFLLWIIEFIIMKKCYN